MGWTANLPGLPKTIQIPNLRVTLPFGVPCP